MSRWWGTPDLQSLADLANSFAVVRRMRFVPCTAQHAGLLALATIVPMTPLLLLVFPLKELITRIVRSLLNV